MKRWSTLMLARTGVIAALYAALTFACFPVASGMVQFRLSEMLTLLPLFYVEAAPALMVGCFLSNLMTGCGAWDIIFGALITLVAAVCTRGMGKLFQNAFWRIFLGGFFPVALNAMFLPLIWWLSAGELQMGYWLNVGALFLSQGVIIWGMGTALYFALKRLIEKNIPALTPTMPENKE